ncbi:MAG: hypothetical protein ABEJ42_06395 [Halobacteriaceae archaeon]
MMIMGAPFLSPDDESHVTTDAPSADSTDCPSCGSRGPAVVPADPEAADGKVWADCLDCGERFLVHYRWEGSR